MNDLPHLWVYLLQAMTFGFAAAVQPGPLSLYLISQTLSTGWKRTLPAIFSPLITDGPIAVVCLYLLSKVPIDFLNYVQILGGIFIFYLAFQAIKTWKVNKVHAVSARAGGKTLLKAVIVNFLNPGPYLGWSLIIGPLFLKGWHLDHLTGIILILDFYSTMLLTMGILILLFQLARGRTPKLQRHLIGISGILLAFFGLYQLLAGFYGLWKN